MFSGFSTFWGGSLGSLIFMPVFEGEEGSSISLILLDNMDKMGYK
jgi:hypothetical protein